MFTNGADREVVRGLYRLTVAEGFGGLSALRYPDSGWGDAELAELGAMLLIIGYVGAVAVLFLFVVMMLDVDFAELKAEMAKYMPLALLSGVVILMQFAMAFGAWEANQAAEAMRANPMPEGMHNTQALGMILYDQYFLLFQLAGLILLVAMIGAIVLTLRHRQDIKRQDILAQIYRDPAKALELKDVKPGQGL